MAAGVEGAFVDDGVDEDGVAAAGVDPAALVLLADGGVAPLLALPLSVFIVFHLLTICGN